jgi:sulfopyruvate decarboxylase TPP-binding subunit
MSWSDTLLAILKDNNVRLVCHVPDNVLTPLLGAAAADNNLVSVAAAAGRTRRSGS